MRRLPVFVVTSCFVALACDAARELKDEREGLPGAVAGPAGTASTLPLEQCNRCHGSIQNAAPPGAVLGATATDDVRVGAHQQHLRDLTLRAPLACDECHVVPTQMRSPGHADNGRGDVTFDAPASSGLARARGGQPRWDRETRTCSGVYCHGATLDGLDTTPVWTQVDAAPEGCGSCHLLPPGPGSGHPRSGTTACSRCHPGSMRSDGSIDIAAGTHIDGIVQLSIEGCTACHGDPARQPASIAPAPPFDVNGNTDSSAPGVGAHQRHLTGNLLSGPVSCAECHVIPADAAHARDTVVLTWGPLARAEGVTPTFDPVQTTCTNYCHGATLGGGQRTAPSWTGGPVEAACGACHGLPPSFDSGHPVVAGAPPQSCAPCHQAVSADGSIITALHVNGLLDLDTAGMVCSSCHGGQLVGTDAAGVAIDAAPPRGSEGETSTAARAVGAHEAHLARKGITTNIACTHCHGALPTSTAHLDRRVDLAFNGLAAGTAWDGVTCSNSYCHGRFPGGVENGVGATMTWASGAPEPLGCGSCHFDAHNTDHPYGGCGTCHPSVDEIGTSIVDPSRHLNGIVDRLPQAECNFCHRPF